MRERLENKFPQVFKTLLFAGTILTTYAIADNAPEIFQRASEINSDLSNLVRNAHWYDYAGAIALSVLAVRPCIYSPRNRN